MESPSGELPVLRDARQHVTALYQAHALGLYRRWSALRDADKALGYLRSSVVNNCRTLHRVIFSGPSSLHAFSRPYSPDAVSCAGLRITPDGQTAICGTRAGLDVLGARPGCAAAGPRLVAYSVRGSQRERILYGFPPCDTGNVVPVWTDTTGSTVVGLFPGTSVRSGRTVLGVLSGHKLYSLPLPVTPVDGTGDGNAIAF